MYMNKMKIPVKIGSHSIMVSLHDKTLHCEKFISIALESVNLKTAANKYLNTYSLIESSRGIDRIVRANENMFELWSQWKSNKQSEVEFIIKKFKQSKLVCNSIGTEDSEQSRKMLSKVLKKAKAEDTAKVFQNNSGIKSKKINELLARTQKELKQNQAKLKGELYSLFKISKKQKKTISINNMISAANKKILSKIEQLKSMKFDSYESESVHIYEEINEYCEI